MTVRKTLSIVMATLVLSATFATAADAATRRRAHHPRQAMHRTSAKARPAVARDGGSAQTDALNQQSLDAARGAAQ